MPWGDPASYEQPEQDGFVTQVAKGNDGDTDIRICENPKINGMDRARCIVAECISKIPCDVPQVDKPITKEQSVFGRRTPRDTTRGLIFTVCAKMDFKSEWK